MSVSGVRFSRPSLGAINQIAPTRTDSNHENQSTASLTRVACCGTNLFAQGTDFTYQGYLTDGGSAANGEYDLQFTVYNALAAGAPVGATTTVNDLAISNGLFTVTVSPGASGGASTGASVLKAHSFAPDFNS